MNRLPISLVSVVCISFSALGLLGAKTTSMRCEGPAITTIKVLKEHTEGEAIYKYTVVNNSNHGITFLVIGHGPFMKSTSNQENISFNLQSPRGWKGEFVSNDNHDHPYVNFYWVLTDKSMSIKPGKSLSGFELEKVTPNPTLSSLSFWAGDNANICRWGKVELKQ